MNLSEFFEDKHGNIVLITNYVPEEKENLVRFYEKFDAERRCCGLPPVKREAIEQWIDYLSEKGYGFIAKVGDEVVGHIGVVPYGNEAEFVIFVRKDYEGLGIGKELIRFASEFLKRVGVEKLVAITEAFNKKAIETYLSLGFAVTGRQGLYVHLEKMLS
ncbi:MAG: GNAT family N-acetyltransferase [Archaeoglobaceae archaeon]